MPIAIIIALEVACLAVYVAGVTIAGVFTKKGMKKHNVSAQIKLNREMDKEIDRLENEKQKNKPVVKNIKRLKKLRRSNARAKFHCLKWHTKDINRAYTMQDVENIKKMDRKLRKKKVLLAKAAYKEAVQDLNSNPKNSLNKKIQKYKDKADKIVDESLSQDSSNFSYTRERKIDNFTDYDNRTRMDSLRKETVRKFEQYVKNNYSYNNNGYPILAEISFNEQAGLNNTRVSSPDKKCLDYGLDLLKEEAERYAVENNIDVKSLYPLTVKEVDLRRPKKVKIVRIEYPAKDDDLQK